MATIGKATIRPGFHYEIFIQILFFFSTASLFDAKLHSTLLLSCLKNMKKVKE